MLHRLFEAAGLLGGEVRPGVHTAVCPNEAAHTKGERHDGSTVLFPPGAGEVFGHLHCSHAHCEQQTLVQVLRGFAPERVSVVKDEVSAQVRAARENLDEEERRGRPSTRAMW